MSGESRLGEAVARLGAALEGVKEAVDGVRSDVSTQSDKATEQLVAIAKLGKDVDQLSKDVVRVEKHAKDLEVKVDRLGDTLDPEEYASARGPRRADPLAIARAREADERANLWKRIGALLGAAGGGGGILYALQHWLGLGG